MFEDAARGADDEFGILADQCFLLVEGGATNNESALDLGERSEFLAMLVDLMRQFARRQQDQRAGGALG